LYVWGQGDGGWLGIPPPEGLPVLGEGEPPFITLPKSSEICLSPLSAAASKRDEQVQQGQEAIKQSSSFDSRHNVLEPERLNRHFVSPHYIVEKVRCGGSHTVVFLTSKIGGDSLSSDEEELTEDERCNRTAQNYTKNNSNDSDSSSSVWTKTDSTVGDSLSGSKRATS
jgi:hypothetical protein